jgi:carboxyl-terminal processing protease
MSRRNLRWLIAVAVVSGLCYAYVPRSRYSRVLADNFDRVARAYYRPINEEELFEGAMRGLAPDAELREILKSPLDEHSRYIKAAKKSEFDHDLNQEFVGIGIHQALDPKRKQLLVLSPVPDGPAVAAGIRAGDRIVKIDGQSTQGMSLQDSSARIKGPAGTPVTLTVERSGSAQPIEVTINRRMVHGDTVEGATRDAEGHWDFLLRTHLAPHDAESTHLAPRDVPSSESEPCLGYVAITGFVDPDGSEKSTAADFRAALQQLRRQNIRGLVLDLRDNRGGSLRQAVEICDMLVAEGQIVTMRGRDHQIISDYRASGKAAFANIPIAVLVNAATASASEIVAACLQDHSRAVVVGQRSFGKGTVQQVFDLGPSLGDMKLTMATYWRPSGRDINRPQEDGKEIPWGVSPDQGHEVPVSNEEREKLLHWQQEREVAALTGAKPPPEVFDRVLQNAVEYLESAGR